MKKVTYMDVRYLINLFVIFKILLGKAINLHRSFLFHNNLGNREWLGQPPSPIQQHFCIKTLRRKNMHWKFHIKYYSIMLKVQQSHLSTKLLTAVIKNATKNNVVIKRHKYFKIGKEAIRYKWGLNLCYLNGSGALEQFLYRN